MIVRPIVLILFSILLSDFALAQFNEPPRPDDYGPSGILQDRAENRGSIITGYRLDVSAFAGHRDGSRKVSDADMLSTAGQNFRVIPTRLASQEHTFSVGYGVTDKITVWAELPLVMRQMRLMERDSTVYSTQSSGVGNLAIMGMYEAYVMDQHKFMVHAGFTLATGSISESDVIPDSDPESIQLPYVMQTGSGTADFLPGFTYKGRMLPYSWGFQLQGIVRGGDNANSYRIGHHLYTSLWGMYLMDAITSLSLRIETERQGAIEGGDPAYSIDVNARNLPTVFPEFQGYNRASFGAGFNTYVWNGSFSGLRFGMELMVPVFQNMTGPQLEKDIQVGVSLRYALREG